VLAGRRRGWILVVALLAACSSSHDARVPRKTQGGPRPLTFQFVDLLRNQGEGLPPERISGVVDLTHEEFSTRELQGGIEIDEIQKHGVELLRSLCHDVVVDPWPRVCPDATTKWFLPVANPYRADVFLGGSIRDYQIQGYQKVGRAVIDATPVLHLHRGSAPEPTFDAWVDTRRNRLLRTWVVLADNDRVDYADLGEQVTISDPIGLPPCHNAVA
jgi:hypothetical protein